MFTGKSAWGNSVLSGCILMFPFSCNIGTRCGETFNNLPEQTTHDVPTSIHNLNKLHFGNPFSSSPQQLTTNWWTRLISYNFWPTGTYSCGCIRLVSTCFDTQMSSSMNIWFSGLRSLNLTPRPPPNTIQTNHSHFKCGLNRTVKLLL